MWGTDDERGALNLVTPERVLRALTLPTEGRVVSLAQPVGPEEPTAPHRPRNGRFMMRDAGDYALGARSPDGFRFAEDIIQFSTHNGTHVDALSHAWCGDEMYNGHPATSVRSTRGAQRLGADKLSPVLTRGVLLDLVGLYGRPLAARTSVETADIRRAYERAGIEPAAGDAVLIRTGWWESASPQEYYDNEPGISGAAADWLAQQEVSLVGADNYAVEVQPSPPGQTFPGHLALLHAAGVPLLENLALAELAATGRAEFLFVFAPIAFQGSTASPIRPLAVL
jgi:kynurenine formamidase